MNVVEKTKKLEQEEKARTEEVERQVAAQFKALDKERDVLHRTLRNHLTPFHGETIAGHKIAIKEKNKAFKMFLDGEHFVTFLVHRFSSRCSCDYPCECETAYWHLIQVEQERKDGDSVTISFGCTAQEGFEDDLFPAAMLNLIEKFKWREI